MEVQGTELLYEGLALQLGFESRPTLEQFREHVWPVIDTIVRVRWDLTPRQFLCAPREAQTCT